MLLRSVVAVLACSVTVGCGQNPHQKLADAIKVLEFERGELERVRTESREYFRLAIEMQSAYSHREVMAETDAEKEEARRESVALDKQSRETGALFDERIARISGRIENAEREVRKWQDRIN